MVEPMAPHNTPIPPTIGSGSRELQQHASPSRRAHAAPPLPRVLSTHSYASKASFRTQSSASKADDELSRDSDDEPTGSILDASPDNNDHAYTRTYTNTMSPTMSGVATTSLRYHGEDTRPTSKKELRGWYMYAFAAETYVICAIGSFIPILLESLARENGTLLKTGEPCGPSDDKNNDAKQCVVHILGVEVNTTSFAMYTFSISVFVQALLVVSISSAADHGQYRKKLLLGFAWVGSCSVMLYIFVSKNLYLLAALLAIVSNVAFGASSVLLNSFLPLLVRYHPKSQLVVDPQQVGAQAVDDDSDSDEARTLADNNSLTGLLRDEPDNSLTRVVTHEDQTSHELKLSTEISAKGIGIGYAAGLFVQCVSILILVQLHSTTWSLRVVLCIVGAWWALFTIPAAFWLRPRPGPPLPAQKGRHGLSALVSYTVFAWKSLFQTIKLARRLVDIMLFLGAWFLLSDAIATSSSTAILFAKTTLQMQSWTLGLLGVISTVTGIAGALSWSYISRRFSLKPHQTLLACIALFELIPIYGLLGYLPFIQAWGVGGLQQPGEMFPLAAVYGFIMGGLSSYCRAVYGELIPPGSEAAFYALYAITDKGSSVFGPFIVASIIDATGEIRPAFWFLAVLVGLPAPLIYFVDAERGKLEAERLANSMEGGSRSESAEPHDAWENQAMLGGQREEYDRDSDDVEGQHHL